MRIALDAMGTDNRPASEVAGAVAAAKGDSRLTVVLVGDQNGCCQCPWRASKVRERRTCARTGSCHLCRCARKGAAPKAPVLHQRGSGACQAWRRRRFCIGWIDRGRYGRIPPHARSAGRGPRARRSVRLFQPRRAQPFWPMPGPTLIARRITWCSSRVSERSTCRISVAWSNRESDC